jgi:hypothetical protein
MLAGLLSTESKHTDTLAHALICTFLHHLPSSHACRLVKYGKQAHWHIGTRAHLHVCTPFIIIACLQACWVRKAQRSRRVLDCEELLVGKVWQRWLHQRRTWGPPPPPHTHTCICLYSRCPTVSETTPSTHTCVLYSYSPTLVYPLFYYASAGNVFTIGDPADYYEKA